MPNEIVSRPGVAAVEEPASATAAVPQARWDELPDLLLLAIFRSLHPRSLLRASQVKQFQN